MFSRARIEARSFFSSYLGFAGSLSGNETRLVFSLVWEADANREAWYFLLLTRRVLSSCAPFMSPVKFDTSGSGRVVVGWAIELPGDGKSRVFA